jgi:glycosyltransferase involved in cell wall biosynthesis
VSPFRRRIVFISDARLSGGAEVYLELLAAALDRSRFEPAAILDPSPQVSPVADRLAGLGLEVIRLRVRGPADLPGLARLSGAVRGLRADLAHVNLPSSYDAACSMAIVAARAGGARVVTTEHVAAIGRSRRRRVAKGAATRMAARVISISRANVPHLRTHGVPGGIIRVVPNGVPDPRPAGPAERAEKRSLLRVPEDGLLVAAVGSLVERKGHSLLLRALAEARDGRRLHLAVVGDGPLRGPLEALAADLGIGGRVSFLGHREDAVRWSAASDFVVLASRLEGMPLCILEAMGAGVPALAFAIEGMDEVVEEGVTGLLAVPGDSGAFARGIEDLAGDPARRARMGLAARARFEERFTVERMARDTMAVYEEALE